MKKKYRIFISSTFEDLKYDRAKVSDQILKMGHIPVGMELFSLSAEGAWETISRTLRNECDYMILLVGWRFGTSHPKHPEKSYTMMEYEYAEENDIPLLCLLTDDKKPRKPSNEEKSNKLELQKIFRELVYEHSKRNCKKFKRTVKSTENNSNEIASYVQNGLSKLFLVSPKRGLILAPIDNINIVSPQQLKELIVLYYSIIKDEIGRFSLFIDDSSEINVSGFKKGYYTKAIGYYNNTGIDDETEYLGISFIEGGYLHIDLISQDKKNADRIKITGRFINKDINSINKPELLIFGVLQAISNQGHIQAIEIVIGKKNNLKPNYLRKNHYETSLHKYLWTHRNNFHISSGKNFGLNQRLKYSLTTNRHNLSILKHLPGSYRVWTYQIKVNEKLEIEESIAQSVLFVDKTFESMLTIPLLTGDIQENSVVIGLTQIENEAARVYFSMYRKNTVDLISYSICEIPSKIEGAIYSGGYCDYGIIENRTTGQRQVISGYFIGMRDSSNYKARFFNWDEIKALIFNENDQELKAKLKAMKLEIELIRKSKINKKLQ